MRKSHLLLIIILGITSATVLYAIRNITNISSNEEVRKGYFPKGIFSSDEWVDKNINERVSGGLIKIQEPSLYELSNDKNKISYRLGYGFNKRGNETLIRIDISLSRQEGKLYIKEYEYNVKSDKVVEKNSERELNEEEIKIFLKGIKKLHFSKIKSYNDMIVCDGYTCMIEGAENGTYHLIRRIGSKDFTEDKQLIFNRDNLPMYLRIYY